MENDCFPFAPERTPGRRRARPVVLVTSLIYSGMNQVCTNLMLAMEEKKIIFGCGQTGLRETCETLLKYVTKRVEVLIDETKFFNENRGFHLVG